MINKKHAFCIFFLLSVLCALLLLASCSDDIGPVSGDTFTPFIGPSGGYVFYENPNWDSKSRSATDTWRYLEAAPSDIIFDTNDLLHIFGYHRVESSNIHIGTSFGIGAGKANTIALVNAMGTTAYDYNNDTKSYTVTDVYAAKLCNDFSVNSLNDWFLPSKGELDLMYLHLHREGLGDFSNGQYYWTSSEHDSTSIPGKSAWRIWFKSELDLVEDHDDIYNIMERHWNGRVRPIRYYTPD